MPVITMTREMGSLGKDVAQGVAQALGLDIVHQELVEEHLGPRLTLGRSAVFRLQEGATGRAAAKGVDEGAVAEYTPEELFELAGKGNVLIRGWGAAYLLRDVPHVLCVRVCAPMERRVRVLMDRLGLEDADLARREIELNDRAHARVALQLSGVAWQDAVTYDLVLNTERIPVADCVEHIKRLVSSAAFRETPASRDRLAALKLAARIRAVLHGDERTARQDARVEVQVEPGTGRVTLHGVAFSKKDRETVAAVVGEIEGVKAVDNRITRLARYRFE